MAFTSSSEEKWLNEMRNMILVAQQQRRNEKKINE